MTGSVCTEMGLLMQADMDGELSAAESARVASHLAACAACTAAQLRLLELSASLRQSLPRHEAPPALRRKIDRSLGTGEGGSTWKTRQRTWHPRTAFGAGFALAACVALLVTTSRGGLPGANAGIAEDIVSAHIRALQPGHLQDVVSTDQHTVKPWFDGRLPFAPPVKDFAPAGFPLAGGRLDFVAGHTAAALIYHRDKHVIDVFVWPGAATPSAGAWQGYNYLSWQQNGMTLWAVSDLNSRELALFADMMEGHRKQ